MYNHDKYSWYNVSVTSQFSTNLVSFSTKAHEEVIRLDISVQIAFRMHKFYSCYLQS
jgi:hypothetical protein